MSIICSGIEAVTVGFWMQLSHFKCDIWYHSSKICGEFIINYLKEQDIMCENIIIDNNIEYDYFRYKKDSKEFVKSEIPQNRRFGKVEFTFKNGLPHISYQQAYRKFYRIIDKFDLIKRANPNIEIRLFTTRTPPLVPNYSTWDVDNINWKYLGITYNNETEQLQFPEDWIIEQYDNGLNNHNTFFHIYNQYDECVVKINHQEDSKDVYGYTKHGYTIVNFEN